MRHKWLNSLYGSKSGSDLFTPVFQCDIKDLLNKSHNGPEIISAHSRINPAMTYFFLHFFCYQLVICYHHSYGHLLVRYLRTQSPSHEHISTAVKFVANSTSICTSGSDGSDTNVMIEEKQLRYRNPPQNILLTFISLTSSFPTGDRLIQV